MNTQLIEDQLVSKAKNQHYAKRYVRFIAKYANEVESGHKHHILPKAPDMWPEYSDLNANSWNCAVLTPRQHYIAHWMLWKAVGGSQRHAFWLMLNTFNEKRCSSRVYESILTEIRSSDAPTEIQRIQNIRAYHATPEARSKASIRAKETNSRPDVKLKLSVALSKIRNTPEDKERNRKMALETWADPTIRKRRLDGQQRAKLDPDYYKKRSEQSKETNNRPEVKEKMRIANSGKPKPKVVCRIEDRKEFNSATWNRWVAKSPVEMVETIASSK